jgi:predicted phosphodiesterase
MNDELIEEKKVVQHLGAINGKLLFFGGIYSNLQALESLRKWADENNYDPKNIFCTGDVLGYCAQPMECIALLKEWNIHVIAGNVELQIRNDEDDCGCDFIWGGRCDLFSKNWYSYIRKKIDAEAKQWLHTLPHHIKFSFGNKKITLVHGSWFYISEFIFRSTPWNVKKQNFEAADAAIIIGGHCGIPFSDTDGKYLWLNAGVIGMPANDGTTRVWFLTMNNEEAEKSLYQFHSLEYDHQTASQLMLVNGLPKSYAHTLGTGIWDNCEILPEWETAQQGKPILLKTETL